MSRTHGKADIYVDDELRWEAAILIEQPSLKRVRIKTRDGGKGAYRAVANLDDAEYVGQNGTGAQRWSGTIDGQPAVITKVQRAGGCQSCGG